MRTLPIDNREEILEILRTLSVCFLAVSDKENAPYAIPMNFGIDEEKNQIILHSAKEGRLYDILQVNPKACVTFCTKDNLKWQDEHVACSYRSEARSVVAEGEVKFIEDMDEKVYYLNGLMKNYSSKKFEYRDPAVRNVAVFVLEIEMLRGKHFGAAVKKSNWGLS